MQVETRSVSTSYPDVGFSEAVSLPGFADFVATCHLTQYISFRYRHLFTTPSVIFGRLEIQHNDASLYAGEIN